MADEKKKTKIDLKARLGKTQTGMGSSVPLPVPGATPSSQPGASAPPSSDGVPPPVVPSSAPSVRPSGGGVPAPISAPISPGIPLPPFAQPRASQREPAAKPTAAQQTIVVEVGEEIHQERRKATRRTALFAALALALGVGIGFVVGGARETRARVDLAIKSAGDLEKEVKTSNEKISEIGEKLKEAVEKLGRKDFPADLAGQLSGLVVPFETGNLDKPGVGSMGKTLKPLMRYTAAVEELNADREQLKNVLTQLQPQVEKAWKE
ncbi:MAG: formin, partial [Polyangiaceae bacterium]